ncbi:signal peptidase II [Cellulomonas sp. DKR-3]|uniref:Lipoprotein signal peptidase n=1 Tax=Cellulomonas fulva TaxID=2835530 RepID=A0ABS5U3B0_9CELL|nr:signal peptidase II [Cellulomonas fulva]
MGTHRPTDVAAGTAPLDVAADGQPDVEDSNVATRAPRRRGLVLLLVAVTLVVLVADQLSKAWALRSLDATRQEVLGDWLGLQLVFNPGAALSIATGMTWVLTLVAIGVVVVVVRIARRLGSTLWALALGLLLGGALGNLMDRLFREPGFARGHVIDFIAYADWFVGNVADIAIVVAAGLIVIAVARGVGVDGTRETHDEAHDEGVGDDPADETADETADDDADGTAVPARRADGPAGA